MEIRLNYDSEMGSSSILEVDHETYRSGTFARICEGENRLSSQKVIGSVVYRDLGNL
jgi:hypothetical protein